jgi:hypothetical protein
VSENRPLTSEEADLIRWMLEHGKAGAADFLPQLEKVQVTPWRCPCGCASINFEIKGQSENPSGFHIVADFVFGDESNLSGIFVFEKKGVLRGLEVYGLAGDAPKSLPLPNSLRPLETAGK